jgi:CheY-like chemotaxis protein
MSEPRHAFDAALDGQLEPPAGELPPLPPDAMAQLRRTANFGPDTAPRLLLIDDDFILRAHLAELLMLEGYAVTCAADGAEALRRLEMEPLPSMILVDIMLPRMSGISFRQTQLRTPHLRDVPTIALTAARDLDELERLGFSEIMRKPVNFDHLTETLAKFCHAA